MNKKYLLVSILLIFFNSVFFAAPVYYISPNNDGIQDLLEVPLKISDKRFISNWSFEIVDSDDNIVRIIKPNIPLPKEMGFKDFFKQLITPKKDIDIPDIMVWDGMNDSGENAPDGIYYYYVTATDDNGNVGKTIKREVHIDTKVPEAIITPPELKVFGMGDRNFIEIQQTGSQEDLWTGTIKNVDGDVVKTYKWENEMPTVFRWTGTNEEGKQVPDGIYSYEITSTDRAGNSFCSESVNNIIYSTDKPSTDVLVKGSKYFSPGTESTNNNTEFGVLIEIPGEETGNRLTKWNVNIRDSKNKIIKTYNNSNYGEQPPESIIFDGMDDKGNVLADGEYKADVSAEYLNGYVPEVIYSPSVILSTVKSEARVIPSEKVFGAGSKKTIDFDIRIDPTEGAPVKEWIGYIKNMDDSSIVRTYDFGEYPPDKITWDGLSDDGELAEGGKYFFEIHGEDLAGNIGGGKTSGVITFSPAKLELFFGVSDEAFSPNGDNILDIIKFTPVTENKDIRSYDFEIHNERNELVYREMNNNGNIPVYFEWNGKDNSGIVCEDGKYSASLEVLAENGAKAAASTKSFILDTHAPSLVAQIPWNVFSTNGNSSKKDLPISITSITPETQWNAEIRNEKDISVYSFSWSGTKDKLVWDGTNSSGNVVDNGVYSVLFFSNDAAGNSFYTEIKDITVDNREATTSITAEYKGISPNNDDILDTQTFKIATSVQDGIASWTFNIVSDSGDIVFSLSEKDSADLPEEIIWNGADYEGYACEGTFIGTINITYENTNSVSASSYPFVCTTVPPVINAVVTPEYFSPDNDGVDDELYINLSGKTKSAISSWSLKIKDPVGNDFWTTYGDSQITECIVWDGLSNIQKDKDGNPEMVQSAMDYPYEFTVSDDLGMTSTIEGLIPIDVLVIRVGDVLKMAVPSIIFEPDTANFREETPRLPKKKIAKNIQVLNRIAKILDKFKDYKVTIIGHANKLTNNPDEEDVDDFDYWGRALKPLSKERADVIMEYLIEKGVNSAMLSSEGKGGTELIANSEDKNNNWKNRRVEFILEK